MAPYGAGSSRRIDGDKLQVDAAAHPGWQSGAVDNCPAVGDRVYCTEGPAEVVKVLGKTGDGTRLLELKLDDPKAKPFFAAASNILTAPPGA